MLKKSNIKVMISSISVVVIIGIIFFVSIMKSTPEKTLVQFTKVWEKGDQKKIKKLLAPEMRLVFEGASMLMGENILEDALKVKTKIIVDNVIYGDDNDTAEVSYYIITESEDGMDNDYNTINMIKIKGKWYVNEVF